MERLSLIELLKLIKTQPLAESLHLKVQMIEESDYSSFETTIKLLHAILFNENKSVAEQLSISVNFANQVIRLIHQQNQTLLTLQSLKKSFLHEYLTPLKEKSDLSALWALNFLTSNKQSADCVIVSQDISFSYLDVRTKYEEEGKKLPPHSYEKNALLKSLNMNEEDYLSFLTKVNTLNGLFMQQNQYEESFSENILMMFMLDKNLKGLELLFHVLPSYWNQQTAFEIIETLKS